MSSRLPLVLTIAASAILFGAIALVSALVIASLVLGGLHFPGGPEIADAAGLLVRAA